MSAQYDLSKFTQPNIQYVDLVLATTARGEVLPDALMWETPRLLRRIIFSCTAFTDNAVATQANESMLPFVNLRWWRRWHEMASGALLPAHIIFDNSPYDSICQPWVSAANTAYSHQLVWNLDAPITVPNRDTMFLDWANPAITAAQAHAGGSFFIALHGYGAQSGKHLTLSDQVVYGASAGGGAAGAQGVTIPGLNARNDFGEDMIGTKLIITRDITNSGMATTESFNHLRLGVRFEPSKLVLSTRAQADLPPVIMWGSHRNVGGKVAILEPQGNPMVIDGRETLGFDIQNATAGGNARTLRMQIGLVSLIEPMSGAH